MTFSISFFSLKVKINKDNGSIALYTPLAQPLLIQSEKNGMIGAMGVFV
ncbi:hypothetical protein [uncultured Desulfosarcina sp.]|nr:hypothetical protein [uncultured Desulfosarcina sp.]